MPGQSEEIDLAALPAWGNALTREVLLGNYEPALKKIAVACRADFLSNFKGAHDPEGIAWPPIKGFRQRYGSGNFKPLQDKGLLRASATVAGAPGGIEETSAFHMIAGTNFENAWIHNDGDEGQPLTIFPRTAKALAIPLTKEAYAARSPRNMTQGLDLIWPKGKTHGWLVEHDVKKKGKLGVRSVMHFMLVPKVTIPIRKFIGWSKGLLARMDDILAKHMAKLAKGETWNAP